MQHTKKSRLDSRKYQFSKLIEQGYTHENYKELDFFTKNEGKYFTLKVYRGTAANNEEYCNYHTADTRAEKIDNYKNNYERRLQYKAEQKEKNKGKSSSHAGAAAAIKAELKAKYPFIKFSVTSESFSMGDSVHISWTDGCTVEEVEAISQKYQYGKFDGMTDMYESTNNRDDIPQAKYVSENRSKSEQVKNILPQFLAMFTGYEHSSFHDSPENIFYRVFAKTSFTADATNLRIEKTDCQAGKMEDFYTIVFDTAEAKPTEQTTQPQYKEVEKIEGEINIVDYSEKAFAVIGDTKPIKDKLKELGGSFNPRLSCGAGWIFSKKKLAEVTAALSSEEAEEPTEQPETYTTLEDINAAAKGGKVISLLNICELVKTK